MIESETDALSWQQKARRWLHPLRHTPLHPQWLALRRERRSMESVAAMVSNLVLDVGCADRHLRHYLSEDARYIGLDYSVTATALYKSLPDVFGNAQSLPFADGCIESVALLDVLEHLPDPEAAIAEIGRVLVPGGMLALQVPFLYPVHDAPFDFHRWTRFGLRRLVESYDLVVVHEESFGHPLETASLIGNIALAQWVLKLLEARNVLVILLGLAAAVLIPLRNISGLFFASLAAPDELMPFGYRMFCRKSAAKRD